MATTAAIFPVAFEEASRAEAQAWARFRARGGGRILRQLAVAAMPADRAGQRRTAVVGAGQGRRVHTGGDVAGCVARPAPSECDGGTDAGRAARNCRSGGRSFAAGAGPTGAYRLSDRGFRRAAWRCGAGDHGRVVGAGAAARHAAAALGQRLADRPVSPAGTGGRRSPQCPHGPGDGPGGLGDAGDQARGGGAGRGQRTVCAVEMRSGQHWLRNQGPDRGRGDFAYRGV